MAQPLHDIEENEQPMMSRFLIPGWVKYHYSLPDNWRETPIERIQEIKEGLKRFKNVENPVVSIIIPAYNEEGYLMKTLSSISKIKTNFPTELFVINNNSTDATQEILDLLEVNSYLEKLQGVSFARQSGLERARGEYIVNADSDSIYPETWVDAHVAMLQDKTVSCSYGRYSFIPTQNNRISLGFYEMMAEVIFRMRMPHKEYFNVMGFNFSFRRADGIQVGGYNTKRKVWEDGWMGMLLKQVGNIKRINDQGAWVWTTDRRLLEDGSLSVAFLRRVSGQLGRIYGYLFPVKDYTFKPR